MPLYAGAATLVDLVRAAESRGFTLMGVEPGFGDPQSGQLLQLDGLFFRTIEAPAVPVSGARSIHGEVRAE